MKRLLFLMLTIAIIVGPIGCSQPATAELLKSLNDRLLKYFMAFEKGTLSEDDVTPRIKELRAEQMKLENARNKILADGEDDKSYQLDAKQILLYVKDLKTLLEEGTFTEQKAFLRSFIKRIDFAPHHVAINYTIPMPVGQDGLALEEVLSMELNGGPPCTIRRTFELAFSLVT
jgi:hypothetical protein